MHQDPPPLYNGAVVGIAFMETEKLFAHKHFWLHAGGVVEEPYLLTLQVDLDA